MTVYIQAESNICCSQNTYCAVVSCVDPMRKVSWMLFPGGTELGTHVKTGSRAGRTHTLNNPHVECFIVCNYGIIAVTTELYW